MRHFGNHAAARELGRAACVAPRTAARRIGVATLLVAALAVQSRVEGGLLADFSASYALYEECISPLADHDNDGDCDANDFMLWQRGVGLTGQTNNSQGDADRNGTVNNMDLGLWMNKFGSAGGHAAPVCFKLYLDPTGIADGQVTAFIDLPDPGVGVPRFNAAQTGIFQTHPGYNVSVASTNVIVAAGRQRIETKLRFTAVDQTDPPEGPITILGYQVGDITPQFGLNGIQTGFNFGPGDFVTTFDVTTGQPTTLTDAQLQDVSLQPRLPLLTMGDAILAIDIDPPSSRSIYPFSQPPAAVADSNPNNQYANLGKRNTGFITTLGFPGMQPVRSLVFTTGLGEPAGDPVSWELYGTNQPVVSPDNSDGSSENWEFISGGSLNLPLARGVPGQPASFDNNAIYSNYRIVFPNIRNFRAATAMQIGDVGLFPEPNGQGPNLMQIFGSAPIRAIQLPTPEADSPPNAGPRNQLDRAPFTKYRNFGQENAGFIVTPSGGISIVNGFMITTANDFPERDPVSWVLYGTLDAIVSEDFGLGIAENWTLIASGTVDLPDERFEAGPLVQFGNGTLYTSYRMVFPSLKGSSLPSTDSVQIGDLQFYGISFGGVPATPVPEPGTSVWMFVGIFASSLAKRRAR
jgi:hypothetical protein